MLVPGLVSARSPQLPIPEVIRLATETGLRAIEWAAEGIPVGDTAAATRAGAACRAAGITVCSYGSDFQAGASDAAGFAEVLRTARALGARSVQVWAGERASSNASLADWTRTVHALRIAVAAASEFGIRIGLRYRRNTLADTIAAAQQLLREVSQDNLSSSWQPSPGQTPADALTEFHALLPGLNMIHLADSTQPGVTQPGVPQSVVTQSGVTQSGVAQSGPSQPSAAQSGGSGSPAAGGPHVTQPLAGQAGLWQPILGELAAAPETRYALLTAGAADSADSIRRDAETLLSWVSPAG